MTVPSRLLLVCCSLASLGAAQKPDDAATQLATMETAAKNDVAALLRAANWAEEHGLPTEARRLLQRVLQLAPDDQTANAAVGNVRYEGRWMSPEKAEILKNRAAGMVSVGGIWVPEAEAEDARAGVFHFGGERVGRAEYLDLRAGKVRHPRTGELVAAADAEKAKNNLFPDGRGGWIDEAAANNLHANLNTPWILRTKSTLIVSTMPLKEVEQQAQQYVDDAYDFALGVLGAVATPARRPVLLLVGTSDQFRDLGNRIGGPSSAYGAFLAEGGLILPGVGRVQPAVALLDPNWGVYYLKHAVGLAVAHAAGGGSLPAWFVSGTGSYTERFYSPDIANWFGKQFLAAGGLLDLGTWFRSFVITGDMDNAAMGQQLYQAGLLLAFCRHGGDAGAAKLLDEVGRAVAAGDGDAVTAAVAALQTGLVQRAEPVRDYVKALTR